MTKEYQRTTHKRTHTHTHTENCHFSPNSALLGVLNAFLRCPPWFWMVCLPPEGLVSLCLPLYPFLLRFGGWCARVLSPFVSHCTPFCCALAAPVTQNHISKLEDLMLQNGTPPRKCASRHNEVHFLNISTSKSAPRMVHFDLEMCFVPQRRAIFHLSSGHSARCFSELTFRPSGATRHWKNTMFRDFSPFSLTYIFFLLTLSLL